MTWHTGMLCSLSAVALLGCGVAMGRAQAPDKPPRAQVWMMPSPWPGNGACMKELLSRENEWPQTRGVVDGIGYWPALLNVHFSDDEIRALFAAVRKWGLPFNMEVPVLKKELPTARQAFEQLEGFMKRFRPLGATIDVFSFDEPFYTARHVAPMPEADAAREVTDYIRSVRRAYPSARLCDIEPYPALTAREITGAVERVQAACAEAGVAGLDTLRLDVDWCAMGNWLSGSWREVKGIEEFCRKRKIRFSLICWSADYPKLKELGLATDTTWYVGVMHTAAAYAAVGGAPDEYMVESWVHVPEHAVPETRADTFTRSVLDLARMVKRTGAR